MSLNKLGKDELKIVAEELNLTVPEGAKIAGLKNLIVNSDAYKNDKELVQSAIDYALAEIKNKRLDSEIKLEFEQIKLAQLQKQLELANIQKNLIENSDIQNPSVCETAANCNVETLLKSVKTLTIPVPSRVESYNLFFQSLEKAFKIKEVPEQFKCEILLNILGANIFYELLKPERIKIKDSQLLLVNSVFGYIVTGNLDSINETKVHCGLIRDEDLNKNLEKFWKLEENEEPIVKNKERLICEEHYANTHFRTKEGKYVVSMPLKKEPSCLGNSKDIALKRLGSLWNRLARDKNYLNLYREFLGDYERLGHMKEVTNEKEPKIAYYATHHGIYRPEKSTTKLRVVFNCSSLTDNGISLNDIQYNGGVIQEGLICAKCSGSELTQVIEIHGFADAPERCYGAAVYCKSKNLKSETLVRLITSKSRVAPIKSLTIPRLELCAAVLLAKLVKRVVAALQLETAEVYLWSDSMIVLAWLRKEPMDLKTFVQNRVAKIQELYPNQLWRHVPSDQNPADLVSRESILRNFATKLMV
ncbi:uncharacterized protein TNCV_4556911 [Trichonephila clavipes]|nr:uncharacterized protein TNCV_4556911 [Trichonephila clavipes]